MNAIYTNYHDHCWQPAEMQKERRGWGSNYHYVHFTSQGMEFASDEPRVCFSKNVQGKAEVVEEMRKIGIEFEARLYGPCVYKVSDIDLKKYEVRTIYVRPEDYETHVAAKVHNLYQQKKIEEEIAPWRFKRVMDWYNLLQIAPATIQKACCNEVAVGVNRPLSAEEERAFAPAGGKDLDRIYTTLLVLRSDNLAYENRLGHVWMPHKITCEDWDETSWFQFDGEKTVEIKPEVNGRIYVAKAAFTAEGRAVFACKEHKIPYISHGYHGGFLYLLPQDYKTLMGRVHNAFDPDRPVLKDLDAAIVQRVTARFPSAVDCQMSQQLWLHLFWNALEIEHNRPLTEREKQQLVPEKSSVVPAALAAKQAVDTHAKAAEDALEEIRKISQVGSFSNHPRADELSRKVADSHRLMTEALNTLKSFSQ